MTSESFQNRILRKIQELEDEVIKNPFTIAVLGPGKSNLGFRKRQQILEALRDNEHNTFMPEDIIDPKSYVPEWEQERLILSDSEVDFIIALNMSAGPLAELSAYCNESSIIAKTFVLWPSQYSTHSTFPSQILGQYPMSYRYSDSEFQRCNLVGECVRRARDRRWQQWRGLRHREF